MKRSAATLRIPVLVLAALTSTGCASALQPLDTTSELARTDAADPVAGARLAQQAEELFARRPDLEAVTSAADLWRQAAVATPASADNLVGAVRALVWIADHLEDSDRRRQVAAKAVQSAQWCGRREPTRPDCHYWLALAIGVQADSRHSTALDGLRKMVAELRAAIETMPRLEHGGPHRVLALVLLRAPGWPTGPGDADEGLEHARAAVQIDSDYPPNLLALAEAYREVDEVASSREHYLQARQLARDWQQRGQPDAPEWVMKADRALVELSG